MEKKIKDVALQNKAMRGRPARQRRQVARGWDIHLCARDLRTTSNVFASGSAREKNGEEKSEYTSDQCFRDRVVVKRTRSSTGDQKTAIRHSYGPKNYATTVHGPTFDEPILPHFAREG
jgi:hypothetical protein